VLNVQDQEHLKRSVIIQSFKLLLFCHALYYDPIKSFLDIFAKLKMDDLPIARKQVL